jgi:hypothetical protein
MILAADAGGRRKLTGSAPRNKPSFHVLVGDAMPGLDLPTRLADFLLLANFHRGLSRLGMTTTAMQNCFVLSDLTFLVSAWQFAMRTFLHIEIVR